MPVGFLISIEAREATSHGATSREAKLRFSLMEAVTTVSGAWASLLAVELVCLVLILDMVDTCAGVDLCVVGVSSGESLLLFLDPSCDSRISSSDEPDTL